MEELNSKKIEQSVDKNLKAKLVSVTEKEPHAIICLLTALEFHGLTTRKFDEIMIALPKNVEKPEIDNPPVKAYHYLKEAYGECIEEHEINGVTVKVYNAEKTLSDLFKFRQRFDMEIFLEALRIYKKEERVHMGRLIKAAKVNKILDNIRPYFDSAF